MAVVLKEQLELRPSVALQKKVGLKSLEQVIRWGDRVNQELRRWRKLEDKKCWRARARCRRCGDKMFWRWQPAEEELSCD